MGANIATEIAEGRFSEATVGAANDDDRALWLKLFNTALFQCRGSSDVAAVEMCGTLKNIVAIGAGFVDGLGEGNNAKAAIMRVGFGEMIRLTKRAFPDTSDDTFLESCGIADLITTCYGGRNRKCAEAFVLRHGTASFDDIEKELLGGQKLQGVLTSNEVQELIEKWGAEEDFPLMVTINRIIQGDIPPKDIVRYIEMPSKRDYAGHDKRIGKKTKNYST
jgi:glycerol-3-phosphate dehydrogenase (NAD+)